MESRKAARPIVKRSGEDDADCSVSCMFSQ
jgi:hypothetical protein